MTKGEWIMYSGLVLGLSAVIVGDLLCSFDGVPGNTLSGRTIEGRDDPVVRALLVCVCYTLGHMAFGHAGPGNMWIGLACGIAAALASWACLHWSWCDISVTVNCAAAGCLGALLWPNRGLMGE